MLNSSNYGNSYTPNLTVIWETAEDFLADYKSSGIYNMDEDNRLDDEHAKLLYFLLYSRYGTNSISTDYRDGFKYQVFSLMFQYGPTWVSRLKIQKKLRDLSLNEEELMVSSKAIYNHAYNPGQAPGTGTETLLNAINEQNTTNIKRSKLDGYNLIIGLLETDVTEQFLDRFRNLFCKFQASIPNLWYEEK